jgi:hypothetical protein
LLPELRKLDPHSHEKDEKLIKVLLFIAFVVLEVEDELEQIRLTLQHLLQPPTPKVAVKLQFRLGTATKQP